MNDVIKGVIGSLIAAALIAAGSWLAATKVVESTVLNYMVNQNDVGGLVSWHLTFVNNTEYAFDELNIQVPSDFLVASSFESSANATQTEGIKTSRWEGKLLKQQRINALFIFSSPNMLFNENRLNNLVSARYQVRDEATGSFVWKSVPLVYGDAPTTSRILKRVGWFFLPFLIVGLLAFGGLYIFRKLKSTPDQAPNHADQKE